MPAAKMLHRGLRRLMAFSLKSGFWVTGSTYGAPPMLFQYFSDFSDTGRASPQRSSPPQPPNKKPARASRSQVWSTTVYDWHWISASFLFFAPSRELPRSIVGAAVLRTHGRLGFACPRR